MIEIAEDEYAQLMKDADDNESIIKMLRDVVIGAIIVLIIILFALPFFNYHMDRMREQASIDYSIATAKAEVQMRSIESEGLTFDEYIRWLEVK